MKKILEFLFFFSLSVCVVACGKNELENNNSPNISTKSDITNNSTKQTEKTLEELEKYLLEKGVLSGKRIKKEAKLIGAISGFTYMDSSGEIYEYDINSENYKKIIDGERIPILGMEGLDVKAASVNGKFVLIGDDVSKELMDAFNSFK